MSALRTPTPTAAPAPIHWRRSKQARRITLRIDPKAAQIVITLPLRASKAGGLALLQQNQAWVARQLAAIPALKPLADGATILIDGQSHPIHHVPTHRGGAWLQDGILHVTGDPAFLARRATDFLRAEARRRFATQAIALAQSAGLRTPRVIVKDTRTRWGSCTAQATLMFSWRLIMAPPFVQHYVIAHEVAHLQHLNHSAAFWALTAQLSPHRTQAEAWLAAQGPTLLRVGLPPSPP